MSGDGNRELELFKKLTIQEIVDGAEANLKRRLAVLSIIAAVLSAAGASGIVYQIMAANIVEKQRDAIREIEKASILSEELRKSVAASKVALEQFRDDQEKLKVETESTRSSIAEGRAQFQFSRTEHAAAQNKSAESLERLIGVLRVQSATIEKLLANPSISNLLGPQAAQAAESALKDALKEGEATVKETRKAAQNSRYTVFIHLSKGTLVPPYIENEIRQWLIVEGYTIGGITRDGSGKPRVDYFFSDDSGVADKIATHIRTKYPDQFTDMQPKDDTNIRNPRGWLGLWL